MPKCERCGKEFDLDYDRDTFEMETCKCYDNLKLTLCADCAISVIENKEDGIYFEQCERCGQLFDPFVDEMCFLSHHSDDCGADFEEFGILCADCADLAYDDSLPKDDIGSDDSMGENLSVDDASEIWKSNGEDEDYMFGYSEEELKKK